jgi:hypothetical protein
MLLWLSSEVGPGNYAQHPVCSSNGSATASYSRRIGDAARFSGAFPQLEMADGTMLPGYTSPLFAFGRR